MAFHGRGRHPPPLGPRAVIDADVLLAEQVCERKPCSGGASTDRAVQDHVTTVGRVDRCEELAHVCCASKRSLFIAQTFNRETLCRGYMAGTTSRLKAT